MLRSVSKRRRYTRFQLPGRRFLQDFLCCGAMRNGRRDGRHAKRAPRAPGGPPAAWEPSLLNFPQLTLALRRWLPGSCAPAILSGLGGRGKQPTADIRNAIVKETEI